MLKKWIRKLIFSSKKEEVPYTRKQPIFSDKTDVEIKMKTLYPKHFETEQYRQRKNQRLSVHQEENNDTLPVKKTGRTKRKRFKPSSLSSPVYGSKIYKQPSPVDADMPEAMEVAKVLEVPETPEARETPEVSETPITPEVPKMPNMPNMQEARETPAYKASPEIKTEAKLNDVKSIKESPYIQAGVDGHHLPPIHILNALSKDVEIEQEAIEEKKEKLTTALKNFNVDAKVIGATCGPTVTRYEIEPSPGVKVNKITNLSDDLKLSLAAKEIRIEAPIPGRSAVGIEVPNDQPQPVSLREVLDHPSFYQQASPLTVALGVDINGDVIVTDIGKMPHGLIAGSTGSGKSVCINSMIVSLLYKASPDEVKLLLIDPKMVELASYHDLPHLITPLVTEPKQATAALKWAVQEMERRYELFSQNGVRDIERYNEVMKSKNPDSHRPALPYIVIIIDELADLMMVSPHNVEESIARIAQKARACGIHLLLATQRPSVDVLTGLIKANVPTRISFAVSSQTDSRTILDSGGAEKLLGRGDMLFLPNGVNKPIRIQGTFVTDKEIEAVTHFVRQKGNPQYIFEKEELVKEVEGDAEDQLFEEAVLFFVDQGQASASALQRRFRIGYNRAARLMDMMVDQGYISQPSGSKPRDVLISREEIE